VWSSGPAMRQEPPGRARVPGDTPRRNKRRAIYETGGCPQVSAAKTGDRWAELDCDTKAPYGLAARSWDLTRRDEVTRRNASDAEELRLATRKKPFERAPGHVFLVANLEYQASLLLIHRIRREREPGRLDKVLCGRSRLR
jgi:hypothetical protein